MLERVPNLVDATLAAKRIVRLGFWSLEVLTIIEVAISLVVGCVIVALDALAVINCHYQHRLRLLTLRHSDGIGTARLC